MAGTQPLELHLNDHLRSLAGVDLPALADRAVKQRAALGPFRLEAAALALAPAHDGG